jgi:hypothetical protein
MPAYHLAINTTPASEPRQAVRFAGFLRRLSEQNRINLNVQESPMGGFFAPDPPAPPPPPPLPPPAPDPEIAAAEERLQAINRNRRGLHGTIATSDSGVLQPRIPAGKTLLGE